MNSRRRFILKGATLAAAGAAAAVADAPNVIAQPRFQWRMSTSWTPALDVLQGGAQRMGRIVEEMSGGRLKIQVFAAGELMPAFGCFDATSQGTIECFMSAPYYWAGKEPAVQWFSAVPFSFNPQGMMAWYLHGDGLKLWEETYAAFGLGAGRAGRVGGEELVADGLAGGVEEAAAAVQVPPALEMHALGVRADEQEVAPFLVAERRGVGGPGDMGLAGIGEFELGQVLLAVGAADQEHGRVLAQGRAGGAAASGRRKASRSAAAGRSAAFAASLRRRPAAAESSFSPPFGGAPAPAR